MVYSITISNGVRSPADGTALRDTAEAFAVAEQSGDDLALTSPVPFEG